MFDCCCTTLFVGLIGIIIAVKAIRWIIDVLAGPTTFKDKVFLRRFEVR